MYNQAIEQALKQELDNIKNNGLYKQEHIIISSQDATITLEDGKQLINMCANNYLGLANNQLLIKAAKEALDSRGYGLSSVRFICGTQDLHRQLEQKIANFLGLEDAIIYVSCFDANAGLFEPLLSIEDAIISDELNHASLIDAIRLCKAQRYRYKNNDMQALETQLKAANNARRKIIVTDGVFSMDGSIAKLDEICALAKQYEAMVVHDDCHATGFIGTNGKGVHELKNCMDKVDIITSTFGKALGGANGGFTAGKKEIIELLRQRSRSYLFSNSLAPAITAANLKALELAQSSDHLRQTLKKNTMYYRKAMSEAGFEILGDTHPIVPIMLYDAELTQAFSQKLFQKGVYAIGFFYPVVPKGKARIRTQVNAMHSKTQINQVVDAFIDTRKELGI